MFRAIVVIAIGLCLLSTDARADELLCATMIAIVGGNVPQRAADNVLWEVRSEWLRITNRLITEEELARISLACVDDPASTVDAKIRLIAGMPLSK